MYYQLLVNKDGNNSDLLNNNKDVSVEKLKKFKQFCKRLFLQCGKTPKCGYSKCSNMIVRTSKDIKKAKHTCKGCKVIMYCSKKCQIKIRLDTQT